MPRASSLLVGGLILAGCTPLIDPGERPEGGAIVLPAVDAGRTDAALDASDADADLTDAAATPDRGPFTPPDAAPPDASPPDASPPLDAGCAPGASLGLCAVCGADGRPAAAEDDDACPVACAPTYRLDEDVCVRVDALETHRCRAAGVCHEQRSDACTDGPPVEVARAAGPCERIVDCAGEVPPHRELLTGTPCNRFGLCGDDGACDVPPECALPGDLRLCSHGPLAGDPTCTVQGTDPRALIDCVEVCGRGGGSCQAAQVASPLPCAPGLPVGCRQRAVGLLCLCTFTLDGGE